MNRRIREYARHRKALGLPGGTHEAVRGAVDTGRVPVDARGVIVDFAAADAAWELSTQHEKRPGAPVDGVAEQGTPDAAGTELDPEGALTRSEALRRKTIAEMELREIELAKRRGELCLKNQVLREWQTILTECRDRLLSIPGLAKSRMPEMPLKSVATLDEMIRATLTDLADMGARVAEKTDARRE